MTRRTGAPDAAEPDAAPMPRRNRIGMVIIRAWLEEGSSEPLRAEVRIATDVSAGIDRTVMFARAEEVGATVQEWLTDVLGDTDQASGTAGLRVSPTD